MQPHMAASLQDLTAMRTNLPVILRWLIAVWANAAGSRFENIGEVVARNSIGNQADQ